MESERDHRRKGLDIGKTFLLEGKRHQVVTKRWGILSLVCFIMLLDVFGCGNFSFVNDITSSYFGITPAITDLQAIANLLGRVASAAVICAIGGWVALRQIILLACGLHGLGSLLITIGIVSKIFGLLAAGMFLSGCAAAIIMSVGQQVSVNWFPMHERGKVTALSLASRRLSSLLSNLIATRATGLSYSHQQLERMTMQPKMTEGVHHRFLIVFAGIFGSLSLSSLFCFILTAIFVSDKPPVRDYEEQLGLPPKESTPFFAMSTSYSILRELKEVVEISRDRPLKIFFILYAFAMTDRAYDATLISSLVLKEFPRSNDQFVGLMFVSGILIATFSGPLVGQILDTYSKPRLTTVCVASLLILAFAASVASFQFHSIVSVFVSYVTLAASRNSLMICLKHRVSGITANQSSSSRFKANAIVNAGGVVTMIISTACVRALMDNFNSAFSVLLPVPFLVCFALSYIFLWSYLKDVKEI